MEFPHSHNIWINTRPVTTLEKLLYKSGNCQPRDGEDETTAEQRHREGKGPILWLRQRPQIK